MRVYAEVVRRIVAPLWAKWEKSPYLSIYEGLKRSQYLPVEQLRHLQWQKARSVIQYAYDNSRYYRERFDAIGLSPEDIRSLEDMRHIPILTKQDLRERFEDMAILGADCKGVVTKTTSGSTGTNVKVLMDETSGQFKRACTLRADEWSGWRLGGKVAAIWGNPEYKKTFRGRLRNLLLERRKYLDTLDMSEEDMRSYARAMVRWKPELIFGHAHSIYLFARVVQGLGVTKIRPRGIIATAMVLHEEERRLIEETFSCKVTNRYGCEEVSLIACECEAHEGLHINAESVYVEFLASSNEVEVGEARSVIVTDLTNMALPILRYEVGDTAVTRDAGCSCGRTLPLIKRIEGRIADYVYTPEGKLISGISLTENFAGLVAGIGQLQIVQDRLDHVLFRIVRDDKFNDDSLWRIKQLVKTRFGERMTYSLEYVDQIEKERSGKYRFCISLVKNPLSHGG